MNACVLAAAFLAGCATTVPAERPEPNVGIDLVISGSVRDAGGEPVEGVEIRVVGLPTKDTTDSGGHYRIETRQPAMDRPTPVRATKVGFFPEEVLSQLGCHSVTVPVGQPAICRVTMDFSLRSSEPVAGSSSTCTVSGRIVSAGAAGGDAVQGVVSVPSTGLGTVTDRAGRYSLSGVPRGLVEIEAATLGMSPQRRLLWVGCDAPDGGPVLDFALYSLGHV